MGLWSRVDDCFPPKDGKGRVLRRTVSGGDGLIDDFVSCLQPAPPKGCFPR